MFNVDHDIDHEYFTLFKINITEAGSCPFILGITPTILKIWTTFGEGSSPSMPKPLAHLTFLVGKMGKCGYDVDQK